MSRAALPLQLIPRGRLARGIALGACVIFLFWAGRELVVRGALWRAGSLARRLGGTAREALSDDARKRQDVPDPLSWLLPPATLSDDDAAAAPSASAPAPRPAQRVPGPTPAPVVNLRGDVVLALAERGAVPRGVFRAASQDLPAGIEILDGGGLGIGWYPGDRLILVGGVPAVDRAQVIRAVLQERSRRAPVITATLARRTREGVATYQVLVEQPYLPLEADPAPGAPAP